MSKIAVAVTSAFLYGGKIRKPNDELELSSKDAKSLAARGKVKVLGAIEEPLEDMTVNQLRKLADDLDIADNGKLKKAELIEAIEAAEDDGSK